MTNFMARAAKKLAKEKGVLSTPNPKPDRSVAETIVEHVKKFYESDDISRQMAGTKGCNDCQWGKHFRSEVSDTLQFEGMLPKV